MLGGSLCLPTRGPTCCAAPYSCISLELAELAFEGARMVRRFAQTLNRALVSQAMGVRRIWGGHRVGVECWRLLRTAPSPVPIVGVGKRGAYQLVYGDLPRQHSFGTTLRFTGPVPADSRQ
ncbi:unnamed protein product [Ascophyllum nodosum]